jgi:hypothetical protein
MEELLLLWDADFPYGRITDTEPTEKMRMKCVSMRNQQKEQVKLYVMYMDYASRIRSCGDTYGGPLELAI